MLSAAGYAEITARLEKWSRLGARQASTGARLIGHVPHIGPEAYLHTVFPGLDEPAINELQVSVRGVIPDHHRAFLQLGNGLSLFLKLALYGLRTSFDRGGDAARQPFHMKTSNTAERPAGARGEAVFIGGYSYDGSKLYVLPDDERVYHCPRLEAAPVWNVWPNLETFLNAEISRFETLFDERGKLINPDQPTAPAAGTYR